MKRFADAMVREIEGLTQEDAITRAEALVSALNGVTLHRTIDSTFDVARYARLLLGVATA